MKMQVCWSVLAPLRSRSECQCGLTDDLARWRAGSSNIDLQYIVYLESRFHQKHLASLV
jgi:hypothetical protein